jgi:protein O-GlcNAc transferase
MTNELKFSVLLFLAAALIAFGGANTQMQIAAQAEQQLRAGNTQAGLTLLSQASAATSTAPGEDRIGFLYAVSGQQDDAATHFRKAIQLNANYAGAHYHLGVLLWLAKDQDHALAELQTAARQNPKSFDYRYRLGAAYAEKGENDKAVPELKAAVALDANHPEAWQQLGVSEMRTSNLAAAVDAYSKAVALSPLDNATRNGYAELLIETRQPERAIEQAQKVLANDKWSVPAYLAMGHAYLKMGEYDKAAKAYQDALAIDSKSVAAHYDLGIALKMQDQIDAAQKELERAIELDPTLGDFPGMIEQMKAAIAIRPDYAAAHYMLGIGLRETADLDGALAELRESTRLDPSTPGPYNTIGQILRIKGDKAGSEEAFATGAKLKNAKDKLLSNSLEQGMRGGVMPAPMSAPMTKPELH